MSTSKFASEVLEELEQPQHHLDRLNGHSVDAKAILTDKPFTEQSLESYLIGEGKSNIFVRFTEQSADNKRLLLHMNGPMVIKMLDPKTKEKDREDTYEKEIVYLKELNIARKNEELIKKAKERASECIASTNNFFETFSTEIDESEIAIVKGNVHKLDEVIKQSNCKPEEVDQLITLINKGLQNLAGAERYAESKKTADYLIGKMDDYLKKPGSPAKVQSSVTRLKSQLEQALEGSDALTLEVLSSRIGKEFSEITSPKFRAREAADKGHIQIVKRHFLCAIFNVQNDPYTTVLKSIYDSFIKGEFTKYEAARGPITRRTSNAHDAFALIIEGGLYMVVAEIIAVHEGTNKLFEIPLPEKHHSVKEALDTFVGDLLEIRLKLSKNDQADESKKILSMSQLIEKVKTNLATYYTEEQGLDKDEINDLFVGILKPALEEIPETCRAVFFQNNPDETKVQQDE